MVSMILSAVGTAIGAAAGPTAAAGATAAEVAAAAATTAQYAQIGGMIGGVAGALIDSALMSQTTKTTGPRLTDVSVTTSTPGSAIPRMFGKMKLSGQILWASRYKETTSTEESGGKGFGGGSEYTSYKYSISFAIGFCEGEVSRMGRVWADGNLLAAENYTIRFYPGTETQNPDPKIEEVEGTGNTPAYRGVCYIVFEDMDLTDFGNRIPSISVELFRYTSASSTTALEYNLKSVNLIPGAGEFVYNTEIVTSHESFTNQTLWSENAHNSDGVSDAVDSLDELEGLAPNLASVSLIAGWFGTDLRAAYCKVRPGAEQEYKLSDPIIWRVNGVARNQWGGAEGNVWLISKIDDRPAYGGTPSDSGVVELIQDMKGRGWKVTFYPFVFMDIAAGNVLPNPYSNGASTLGQPAYPWRGRITCSPAIGYTGSVDKTSAVTTQINAFFGTATSANYSVNGTVVDWTGDENEWGYRRMVLHYAKLCVAAGGVDAFIIGSELIGLTRCRSSATTFPAVSALKTLAADVKAIFTAGGQGSTKIGYAADWTEYTAYQTGDAAGAIQFNLDPLWSDANIDFIGIDNYLPIADWRDGIGHLDYDAPAGYTTIYNIAYLQSNINGGEDYDWYYASQADRDSQTRTTITDGLGKPWVFRSKDYWNWWSNQHYDRVNGTESGTPTAWVPQSKPIWFTELGCPAVDKGPNQPNVFYDPKSSESFFPYYSDGTRDDLVQRRFLEAHLTFWTVGANNPTSSVYHAPMVDVNNISIWTWDARPYPYFPARADIWGDAANYEFGHWLNGRLGAVMLTDSVGEIIDYVGGGISYDISDIDGMVLGYVINSVMCARDAIVPLATAFAFDAVETQGIIKFVRKGQPISASLTVDDLVISDGSSDASNVFGYSITRADESDLPRASQITFIDASNDYTQSSYTAKRLVGNANKMVCSSLSMVIDQDQAIGIGDRLIQESWVKRETAGFNLPPSYLALEPTDEVTLAASSRSWRLRLSSINDSTYRTCAASRTLSAIYDVVTGPSRDIGNTGGTTVTVYGKPLAVFMDIPLLLDGMDPYNPCLAIYCSPWPSSVAILRSTTSSNYSLDTTVPTPAQIGELTYDFYAGPTGRWDNINDLYVTLYSGTLSSKAESVAVSDSLSGNALAIQQADGEWEIVNFVDATLQSAGKYKLSKLLRGRKGSEHAMGNPCLAGARVVVLSSSMQYQTHLTVNNFLNAFYYTWGPASKSISDNSYDSAVHTFKGVGARPYSPCHIKGEYSQTGINGDVTIKWNRRTRSGADNDFNDGITEVPLGEDNELYMVEILDTDNVTVLRQISNVTTPSVVYGSSSQVLDFGHNVTSFHINVYQIGKVTGWPGNAYVSP